MQAENLITLLTLKVNFLLLLEKLLPFYPTAALSQNEKLYSLKCLFG